MIAILTGLTALVTSAISNISVTLSQSAPTGIRSVNADKTSALGYTLQGTVAQDGQKGIIIQNGKKIIR